MKKLMLTAAMLISAATAFCQQAIPEFKNKVMMVTSANALESLDATSMRYDSKGRIGKGIMYISADGPTSATIYKPATGSSFIVKIEPGVDPESVVTLYQFKTDKKSRKIEMGSVGMTGMKNAKLPVVKLNFKKVQDGVYTMTTAAPIEAGEYIFTISQDLSTNSMMAEIKGFAFSVAE